MSLTAKTIAFRHVCARLQELKDLRKPDFSKLYLAYEIAAAILINSDQLAVASFIAKLANSIYRRRKSFYGVDLAYYAKVAEVCGGYIPTRSIYDITGIREDIAILQKVAETLDFYRYTLATRMLAIRSGEDVMKYLRSLTQYHVVPLKTVDIGPICHIANTPTKTVSFRSNHVTLGGNASVLNELLVLSSLHHPLFCKILGVDNVLDRIFIHVADCGVPIRTHSLTAKMIGEVMLQLSRGLAYMHSVSLAHCNLVPSNVLYLNGRVTLVGCSKGTRLVKHDEWVDLSHLSEDAVPPEGWEEVGKTPLSSAIDAWGLASLILFISKEYSMLNHYTMRGYSKASAMTKIRLQLSKVSAITYYPILVKLLAPNPDERLTMEQVTAML